MVNNKKRQTYILKDNGLNNGKYGWVNELTNEWEIEPKYSYESMLHFDFNIYFIQTFFGVSLIKNACLNYDEQLCFRSTNLNCIKCSSRLNDYEERLCDE